MNDIINESFPTTGKVPKNYRIFHGSTVQDLKVLQPRKSYSYPELGPVVFGSFYKPFAACLCLDWTDEDLRQGSNNHDYNDMSLWLLHDMDFSKPCSIYELVNDGSFKVLRDHPAEIYSPNPIRVKKEEKFNNFEEVIKLYDLDLYNYNTKQPLRDYSGILESSIDSGNIDIEDDLFSKEDIEEMNKMGMNKIKYLMFKLYGESRDMTRKAEYYRLSDKLNLTPLVTANIKTIEELEDRYNNQYMMLTPKFKARCNDKSREVYGDVVDSRYLMMKRVFNMINKIEPVEDVDSDIKEKDISITDTSINHTLHEHLKYLDSVIIESSQCSNYEIMNMLLDLNKEENEFTFTESVVVKNFIKDKIKYLQEGDKSEIKPYYTPDEMIKLGVFNEDRNNNFFRCESSKENLDWFLEYSLTNKIDFNSWYNQLLKEYKDLLVNPSNKNKQRILELGWNPELEPTIDNILEASNKLNNTKIDKIDMRNIGNRVITAPYISKGKAILDGGYYDNDNIWNSIIELDEYPNKVFRERVEVIIFDDFGNIYLNKKGNKYRLPGGSTEKDVLDIDQVKNESQEEARICIKDVQYTGLNYSRLFDKKYIENAWFKDMPVVWDGLYTKVYVAKYDKKFTGHVNILDQDQDMYKNGKFYPIDKVYDILKPEHKKAVDSFMNLNESTLIDKPSVKVFNEYKKIDRNLFPVFIITVFTDSPISHSIQRFTNCKYTHAGISLESKLDKIFSFNMNNGEGGGLSIESIKRYLSENPISDMKLMCIFVKKEDINKIKIALDNALANIHNTRYSITNLINIIINRTKKTQDDLSMICSQFVDFILRKANINITNKPNNLVTPADFAKNTNSKVYNLYEGKIADYNEEKINKILSKMNKNARYIKEAFNINPSNEIDLLLESLLNVDLNTVLEYKTFPSVEFTKGGDLLIKNYKKINFEDEYYKSTKLLKVYAKNNNYEAIAYELSKLWFMNSLLEQRIYTSNNKSKLDKYNLIRGKILNTFNRYLTILCSNVEDFNFEEYYDSTPFSDTISIKKSTIDNAIDTVKKIIL